MGKNPSMTDTKTPAPEDPAAMPPSPRARRHAWRWVAVGAALALLVVPLIWPVPPLEGVVPARELADPDSNFVTVDGVEVHYKESAPASPTCNVVLLHGFGASTFSWRDTLPGLAERCRVVAFDRPAFGLSSRPMPGQWEGENPYSPAAQADLTIALMDELGMERAVLVGHSAGAVIAVLAAEKYPERVSGLVLEDPAVVSGGGTPAWIAPLLRTPQARHIGPLIVRRLAGSSSDEFIRSAYADPTLVTEPVLAGYRKPLSAENWDRALWELTVAPRPDDPEDALPKLLMPVLVVYGEKDTFVPPEDSRRAAELLPNATATGIPEVGHIPHEEVPGAFETLVFRFLDDLDAAGVP